ncbi:hypothetical protein PIB30_022488 [Stylosanthes scabra]|uniref:Uncharacterized protein n=1 Tax=Stylosanthes scabra TaxID=79078 RepID=A0ABU6U9G2_9FABA|nr:hypothetical protein [Stylosanthes scabra]
MVGCLPPIAHLQFENGKSKDAACRAFRSIFGKEKPGRVRCHGRVTTPSLLKKNEEIAAIKQQHANEKANLEGKVDVMQQEVDVLKSLVKMLLKQKSIGVDLEVLAAQLASTSANPNNGATRELASLPLRVVLHQVSVNSLLLAKTSLQSFEFSEQFAEA